VNKGLVLLKGNAKTLSDHLTAIEVARSVPGVRRVASEVQSQDELADASVWKERNIAVGGAVEPTAPGTATDLYTTSMVKMALLTNRDTPAMEINVDTRAGVVTLFGMVPSAASKAAAENEARKVSGVVSVKNQLQVVASANQPAVEAKDDVIQADVKKNLEQNTDLGKVTPEVKNCVARLTGTVPSGVERVEAMQIARATKGVCSVKEDLTVQ
jgi:osmotically-inducible protein OsmY